MAFSVPAVAQDAWSSPMRPQLELTTELNQALDIRFGVNTDSSAAGGWRGRVPTEPRDLTASALVDWQIASNGMHVTGGAFYGDGDWGWQSDWQSRHDYERTGAEFDGSGEWTPYLGLGWDQRFGEDQRFAFQVDLGVAFEGVADLEQRSGSGRLQELREEAALGERFESFQYVPMFSAGVEYRF